LKKESAVEVVKTFGEYLKTSAGNPQEIYLAAIKYTKEKTGVKGKDLFMPIRAAFTGKVHGLELDKVFAVLDKNTALIRLKYFND
jgi:nondiscriminating glutamyl-tRNA synthetase